MMAAHRAQLKSRGGWVLAGCGACVGLGYLASSLLSRSRTFGSAATGSDFPDVVETERPHPEWKPPQRQPPPEGSEKDHVQVDPSDLKSCYPLMISAVVPRPIALTSTQAPDGTVNVAPFSYFNTVGHDPPTLAVSICRNGNGSKKDSLVNIEANGEFVVSIMSDWFVESANHSCGAFPPEVDEMAVSGLTPAPSLLVTPPRVKESAVNMECKVQHTYDIVNKKGEVTTTVVFGEVVMFHVLPHLLSENGAGEGKPTVEVQGFMPISRLGGNTYARLGSVFDIPRPRVQK
ncbi:unnamed protein product [Pylaiella littoralis]